MSVATAETGDVSSLRHTSHIQLSYSTTNDELNLGLHWFLVAQIHRRCLHSGIAMRCRLPSEIKMYKELTIENFRSLGRIELKDLGDVNMITGGNGTGKSTILEAVFLNAGANNARLAISLNSLRGDDQLSRNNDAVFHSVFHGLDVRKRIEIGGNYQKPNSQLISRTLRITPKLRQKISAGETGVDVFVDGVNFDFLTKRVRSKKEKLVKGSLFFDESNKLLPVSHSGKVDPSMLLLCRYISPLAPTIQDISDRITQVIKTKDVEQVVELLRIIDPRISSITSLSEGGRNQVYVDIGLDNLMPATYMGGGFIRLLNLAISMSADNIILIDEIENGLHYSTHEPLLRFIFEAAARLNRQIFLTTHSSEFLDKFILTMNRYKEIDVAAYRCQRSNGAVRVASYSEEELGLREQLDIELR